MEGAEIAAGVEYVDQGRAAAADTSAAASGDAILTSLHGIKNAHFFTGIFSQRLTDKDGGRRDTKS